MASVAVDVVLTNRARRGTQTSVVVGPRHIRLPVAADAADLATIVGEEEAPDLGLQYVVALLTAGFAASDEAPLLHLLAWDSMMRVGYACPPRLRFDNRNRACFETTVAAATVSGSGGAGGGTLRLDLSVAVAESAFACKPLPVRAAFQYHRHDIRARVPCAKILQRLLGDDSGAGRELRRLTDELAVEDLDARHNGRRYLDAGSGALLRALRAEEGETGEQPPELGVAMLPFQLQCLEWMRRVEEDGVPSSWVEVGAGTWYSPVLNRFRREAPEPLRSGYLATEMGLGKTIVTLARVLQDRCGGPSLVVAPVSLVGQWLGEATRRCPSLRTYCYHGSHRVRDPERLRGYDLVLTTYGVVQSDKYLMARKAARRGVEGYVAPLEAVAWHRVVLDEAQSVSSPHSAQASAVQALRAARRWCLSGTPLMAHVDDLFGQFKFLRHALCEGRGGEPSLAAWVRTVREPHRYGGARATAGFLWMLRRVLLRHEKAQLFRGAPILELPPLSEEVRTVHLCAARAAAYEAARQRAQGGFGARPTSASMRSRQLVEPLRRVASAGDEEALRRGGGGGGGSGGRRKPARPTGATGTCPRTSAASASRPSTRPRAGRRAGTTSASSAS